MKSRGALQLVLAGLLTIILASWSPVSLASLRCCYTGEVVDAEAATLQVKLKDGRNVLFTELFPDFESSDSLFTLMYPVYRLDIARVVYAHLAVKFQFYDANENGFIEEPELNVLYIEELARGLDHPIEYLGGDERLKAVFVTAGDIDGLIRLAKRHRSEMTAEARKTFDEIDLLRIDFRIDGSEPGEQGDKWF